MARLVLAALVASVFAAPATAGPCAIPTATVAPLTPANTTIAPGGGVLVNLTFAGFGGPAGKTDLVQKGWRYHAGGKQLAPAIKTLAPGLAVYDLPADGGDALTLVDDNGKSLVAVKRGAKQPELAAPVVKALEHHVIVSRGPRGGESRSVTVRLATPAPKDAVGLILYDAASNNAVSWLSIAGDPGKEYVVYQSAGRCALQIPGRAEVPAGRRATLAWVDASGRVSPKSKEIVVARGKTPGGGTTPVVP